MNTKTISVLAALFFGLASCSHTYIRHFDNGQVTACCPQKKLACSQDALEEAATKQCRGPAKPVSGGSVDSGASGTAGNAFGTRYVDVGVTRDMCVTFSCQ